MSKPICVECTHHRLVDGEHLCFRTATHSPNLVSGEMETQGAVDCEVSRRDEGTFLFLKTPAGECGSSARYFEKKRSPA